jgi:hypothetical protein
MVETDKKPSATDGHSKKRWHHHKRKPQYAAKTNTLGKDELDGNYFDCTGYGQSDRFVKTVQKIADYIGQEHKCGGVSRTEVVTQSMVTIPMPTRPTGTSTTTGDAGAVIITPPDALDISDYQSAKKIVDYQVQHQTENRQKLFSLVWQQCTESMHAIIRAHREYQIIEQDLNGIELLRIIKLICFNIEDEKYITPKSR